MAVSKKVSCINTARSVLILIDSPVIINTDRAALILPAPPVSINTARFLICP